MRLSVVLMNQDDPKKCTAAKLVRLGLATSLRRTLHSRTNVILDPYSDSYLLCTDKRSIRSITAIDCSWRYATKEFGKAKLGMRKKLPPLLAGNPVNYSKIHKLTTVEAIAGALFILGQTEQAQQLLAKFVWGHTFYELNSELIAEYARLDDASKIPDMLREYNLADLPIKQS